MLGEVMGRLLKLLEIWPQVRHLEGFALLTVWEMFRSLRIWEWLPKIRRVRLRWTVAQLSGGV